MVDSNKILTVAYGTFSCTAEGFDDPLEAVKDTTQYFRDVVQKDRLFGAEPPQLGTDAANALQRRQDSLSAGSMPEASAGLLDSTALSSALPAPEPEEAKPEVLESATAPSDQGSAPQAKTASDAPSSDITPKETKAAPAEKAASPLGGSASTALSASEPEEVGAEDTVAPAETSVESAEAEPEESTFFTAAAPATAAATVATAARASAKSGGPARNSDTPLKPRQAKRAARRAQKAQAGAWAKDAFSAWYQDDTEAPAKAAAPEEEAAWDKRMAQEEARSRAASESRAPSPASPAAPAVPEQAAPEPIAAETAEKPKQRPKARVVKVKRRQLAAMQAAERASEQAGSNSGPSAETVPRQQQPDVYAAALAAQMQAAAAEKPVSAAPTAELPKAPSTSSLSQVEEDELARELAAVKAELEADFDAAFDATPPAQTPEQDRRSMAALPPVAAPPRADTPQPPLRLDNPIALPESDRENPFEDESQTAPASIQEARAEEVRAKERRDTRRASPARALLTETAVEEQDASRLIDQANSELEEPEGSRRRTAIAHLRAAVKATRADQELGEKQPNGNGATEAYRADLANVVGGPAPSEDYAAPDQGLGQQHQNAYLDAPQAPIPGQVPGQNRAQQDFDESRPSAFAAYAQQVGAHSLPQLLEAAASYISFVEGQPQFSRPQLMTMLRQAEVTESSREDRLRSFGLLLREGKIEKASDGRFTAASQIGFRPDARAAG